jgi:hypothetical protein
MKTLNHVTVIIKGTVLLAIFTCLSFFSSYSENNISTSSALEKYGDLLKNQSFIIFPEFRENPIKWFDSIPEGKIKNALHPEDFVMDARPGEFFVFQIGIWALKNNLQDLHIDLTDFKAKDGLSIPADKMTCFNLGGTDFKGNPFSKTVNVNSGRVQALWIGFDLEDAKEGVYTGAVSVIVNGEKQSIPFLLKVSGKSVPNHGYDKGAHLSRLNWLNSNVGINEEITKGYIPVQLDDNKVSILGRTLKIAPSGLLASINSYFDPSNQSILEKGQAITDHPFHFIIEKENGEIVRLMPEKLTFTEQTPSKLAWKVLNTSDDFDLECTAQMEFDGFIDYRLNLLAKVPVRVKDIRLEIPVVEEKAEYMMGLGHEGGKRTPDWKWKWGVSKNQDMLWLGAVNGGMRIKWKAENYIRPLVNIYYEFGPLNLPPSWGNDGKGGVDVSQKGGEVVINAYSGTRELKPGELLNYDFELLITPFRTINRDNKFGDRYYHGGGTNTSVKIENAKKAGANIINIHHAEDIYPFINYPFLDANVGELTQLVSNAHKENLRMKFYYTTRELTKNLPEFWAFNSLNGEVIFPGPGNETRTEALHPKGPNDWLVKNLRENYIPAWYNVINEGKFKGENDLSVITAPDSRLNNFYIAGLDWMVQNMGIDGVYIDDSALDRFTLRRARKIIDEYRPEGRMDLHSWNHFNKWAGFANCLNLYMDLLPYFDLVWIGEGRDYDRLPDHWLIEVSGIPFGLPGQMLEGGGNPWRGMVYGITNRAGWTKWPPVHLWKFFDEYKIAEKEMIGFWQNDCPVACNNPLVKATVYKGDDNVIISVANWGEGDEVATLNVDWEKLGTDPSNFTLTIPEIEDFQSEQLSISLDGITIPGKKGFLIVLKRNLNTY